MKNYFLIIIILFLTACMVPEQLRKTQWTVDEVKEWSKNNKETIMWKGMLLYQGSDSIHHHFISRVIDEWVWFKIKTSELKVESIKPYTNTSSGPFGYYYVDPTKDFAKVKDY